MVPGGVCPWFDPPYKKNNVTCSHDPCPHHLSPQSPPSWAPSWGRTRTGADWQKGVAQRTGSGQNPGLEIGVGSHRWGNVTLAKGPHSHHQERVCPLLCTAGIGECMLGILSPKPKFASPIHVWRGKPKYLGREREGGWSADQLAKNNMFTQRWHELVFLDLAAPASKRSIAGSSPPYALTSLQTDQ